MTTPTTTDRLATAAEVAEFLSVPITTLYAWRNKGAGPQAIRVGKHLRYRWSEVETWLRAQAAA